PGCRFVLELQDGGEVGRQVAVLLDGNAAVGVELAVADIAEDHELHVYGCRQVFVQGDRCLPLEEWVRDEGLLDDEVGDAFTVFGRRVVRRRAGQRPVEDSASLADLLPKRLPLHTAGGAETILGEESRSGRVGAGRQLIAHVLPTADRSVSLVANRQL